LNQISYLAGLIKKNSILSEESTLLQSKIRPIYREIREWAGQYLEGIIPSGSLVKGTAIKGAVDIDLLISLKNKTPNTLKEIYESLYSTLNQTHYATKQNVSIGIFYQGLKLDIVPAKLMPNTIYPHSIYVSKLDTWTKTNIHKHIRIIKNSPHRNIIKLLKIWRKLHNLDFPSFLLELTVMNVLRGKQIGRIDKKFLSVLSYLSEEFVSDKIYDPANTNNVVSDTINDEEKNVIIQAAAASLKADYWEKIVWGLYEKE